MDIEEREQTAADALRMLAKALPNDKDTHDAISLLAESVEVNMVELDHLLEALKGKRPLADVAEEAAGLWLEDLPKDEPTIAASIRKTSDMLYSAAEVLRRP